MLPERLLKTFRLSSDALVMLSELKVAKGVSQTAVLEVSIRNEYKRSAVDLKRVRRAKLAVSLPK